jgi:hypothetical protein
VKSLLDLANKNLACPAIALSRARPKSLHLTNKKLTRRKKCLATSFSCFKVLKFGLSENHRGLFYFAFTFFYSSFIFR